MKRILFTILASFALISAANANTYMEIEGIPGGVDVAGREGSVEVLNLNHRIYLPIDADDGSITGTRKHKALEFIKAIDKSSPLLLQRLTTGLIIPAVKISVYKISNSGEETKFYQIDLTNVKVIEIQTSTSALEGEPVTMEKVSFMYKKITWTYLDGNLLHTDEWSTR